MIKSGSVSRFVASRAKFQPLIRFTGRFCLVTALLAGVAATTPSNESPEEQYIHIMAIVEKADALRTSGQLEAAHVKYVEAEKALTSFKAANPVFFPKTVAYRLKEVRDHVDERTTVLPQTNSTPKPSANLEAAPATKSNVKLLEAGAEPRTQLRYHVKAGDKQSAIVTIKVKLDVPAGAMGQGAAPQAAPAVPAVTVPMAITVQNVAANGDITYQAVMGEATLVQDTNTTPEIAQQMQPALAGIKGNSSTTVMSSRGLVKKTDSKTPANANPQARQYLDQIKEISSALGTELPDEAVGVGAKWEVKQQTKAQGATVDEKMIYEMTALDANKFTIKCDEDLDAMAGGKAAASGVTGSVSGTSTVDLTKVVPSTGEARMHAEVPLGKDKSMAMKMDVSMSIESQ